MYDTVYTLCVLVVVPTIMLLASGNTNIMLVPLFIPSYFIAYYLLLVVPSGILPHA